MHKIHAKKFTLEDFSHEHLTDSFDETWDIAAGDECRSKPLDILHTVINALNIYRTKYLETNDKKYWWQMIQLLPSSYNQTRNVMINYEVALEIYRQRKNHKLDEWRTFCEFVESLPYIDIFMKNEEDKNAEENNKPIEGDLLRIECGISGENYAVISKDGKTSRVPIVYMYK